MLNRHTLAVALGAAVLTAGITLYVRSDDRGDDKRKAAADRPRDPAAEAQSHNAPRGDRPEQKLTAHDRSPAFSPNAYAPVNPALKEQPKQGKLSGFDFARDPLNAPKPFTTFDEVRKTEEAARPKVMADQRKLLEARYDLTPKHAADVTMSRGKPLCLGPTARLAEGTSWDDLAGLAPAEVKKRGTFPYPSLPHPLHTNGGQVF